MKVSSTDVQNNFGKYLKYAIAQEDILITRNGNVVAKLIPWKEEDAACVMESLSQYSTEEKVSYDEFLELTENSDQRFELIDGIVYNLASPSYKHQHVIHELHGRFYNWFKGKSCVPLTSPFDVTLFKAEDNICVVQPDIIVICDKDKLDDRGKYQGVPTLVVEVLSPSTRSKDLVKKLDLYMQCGVKEYWIIDPINETIQLYVFEDRDIAGVHLASKKADESIESVCFEGLSVALKELF